MVNVDEFKDAEREVLAFEGRRLFEQSPEQIRVMQMQINAARRAIEIDMRLAGFCGKGVYDMALEGGVIFSVYRNSYVGSGIITSYRGKAQIEINGRKYLAVGRGPIVVRGYVCRDAFIEFIPQEVPAVVNDEGESLSAEQESLYKMSLQQFDDLDRRVALAAKAMSYGASEKHPYDCNLENSSSR